MPIPTRRDWPDTSLWAQGPDYDEPSGSSTSLDTDPSEDLSSMPQYVPETVPEPGRGCPESGGENSPNSVAELGLRDISDPGPEGSHQGHGGWISTDSSEWLPQHHREDTSYEGPSRSGYVGRVPSPSSTSSGSFSVTSRRRHPRRIIDQGGRGPVRAQHRPNHPEEEQVRSGPTSPNRGTDGRNIVRELRQIVGNMRDRRLSREQPVAPPSPPDYLKMVMIMQQLGTLKFFGDKGPVEADSWIKHLERNFSTARCPEDFKTDVAAHYLLKDACNWWDSVKARHAGASVGVGVTWRQFKREFEKKYFPPEARDRMEAQFQNLVQGEGSVRAYEAEFTRLRQYAHYGISDEAVVIRRFLRGLRPRIMSRLVVNQYRSLFELIERAVDVEEGIRIEQAAEDRVEQRYRGPQNPGPRNQVTRTGSGTDGRRRGQGQGQALGRGQGQGRGQASGRGQGRGPAGRGTPAMDQLVVCYKCGNRGHYARACPTKGQTQQPVPMSVICYTCNQPGHFATSCPVTHPTGQFNHGTGLQAMKWEDEPEAKRPAIEGRVYSLDKPEPSRPNKGPVTGK